MMIAVPFVLFIALELVAYGTCAVDAVTQPPCCHLPH